MRYNKILRYTCVCIMFVPTVALNYNRTWYKRIVSATMGYLVEAVNKMKHMLQTLCPAMFWTTPKNPTRARRVAPRYMVCATIYDALQCVYIYIYICI